jgi:hypothetical protein
MNKKPGLTMDEHRALGAKLHAMYQELNRTLIQLSHAYPLGAPVLRDADRAIDAVSTLRSHLEDVMFHEGHTEATTRVYYPGSKQ